MSNVTAIPGKKDELAACAAMLRRNLPALIEYQCIKAEIQKAAFEALKRQGFTDAQALELAKSAI